MKKYKLHTFLREPLLHFLVIGATLFIIFDQLNIPEVKTGNRIIITQADLDILATTWLKSTGRPPSAQEREQQLEQYVREQVLSREAMAMGLDKDDAIVRRRLAKKMEYLFNDLSFVPEPSETELNAYLSEQASIFTRPAEVTFSQIFFDPALRGQNINNDAEQILKQLQETTTTVDAINLGDRSLLPYEFSKERKSQIAGIFGEAFASEAFALPVNSWQGPVESEYGVHLIHINSRTEAELPPLDEKRERVASEWRSAKQKKTNEVFYQSLHQRYEIVLDDDVAKSAVVNGK